MSLAKPAPESPPVGTALLPREELPDGHARLVLPDGAVEHVPGRWPGVILLREGDAVRGFLNRCPHFQGPLATRPHQLIVKPGQALVCNVHYARFDWRDGHCLGGDCSPEESLEPVAVTVDAQGVVRLG
jgi:nitrite reductase/ring-hydroxylating ferredoxin subunit